MNDYQSLNALLQGLDDKSWSSVMLTEYYIDRITQSNLNAFIHVDEKLALNQAKEADKRRSQGHKAPLLGIPMAHKDIYCTQDMPTTCASHMIEHYRSPFDATVVENLKKSGSICLGKTNMDEFAMGSANEHSYFGPVNNPWNHEHVPGGSSGGSAAAVAAGLVPFATGSDTGGSIRQPAAFCGISGIKPTYGLVSRYGMIAFASSLDQGGPLARSVADLAIVLDSMASFDLKDSTSAQMHPQADELQLTHKPEPKKIGIPACYFTDDVDPEVRQKVMVAAKLMEKEGHTLVDIDFQLKHLWVPCYYVIACAEASSNLSRFDGLRFGHRSKLGDSLESLISHSRSEGFGSEVKRRILTGTHVLSSGYFDDVYLRALKIRRVIQHEFFKALTDVDFILSPTTPTCAFKHGDKIDDPVQTYLADIFTVAVNLSGLPALSIPCGFNQSNLPIGMQLIGAPFNEAALLQFGHAYQQLTDWHLSTPDQKKVSS